LGHFYGSKFLFLYLVQLINGNDVLFCISGSTGFLLGPAQQMSMMFDPIRVFATAIYLGCVVIALICALLVNPAPLISINILSFLWYTNKLLSDFVYFTHRIMGFVLS
jgi:hypothetical protein